MACGSFGRSGISLLLSMEAGLFLFPYHLLFPFTLASCIWRVYFETRNRMSKKDMEQIPQVV
jgi:hypothetical protein